MGEKSSGLFGLPGGGTLGGEFLFLAPVFGLAPIRDDIADKS